MILRNGAVILFCILVYAQPAVRYYQTYADFIAGADVPLTEVSRRAFYQARYKEGRVQELIRISSSGEVESKTLYEYNRSGELVRKIKYDGQERLIACHSYTIDEIQKQLIQKIYGPEWQTYYSGNSTLTFYDSLARPRHCEIQSPRGDVIGYYELEYNKRGDLIRESWKKGPDAELLESYHFSFDYTDSLQTVEQYNARGELVSKVILRIPPD